MARYRAWRLGTEVATYNKRIDNSKGSEEMIVKIPLKQHIGGVNIAVVGENEKVKRGQLIARPEGLGANIHSSVSGEVVKIDECIHIEMDKEQPDDYIKIEENKDKLKMIEEAGIVGAGGAGFPTHVKLKIDLNGGVVIVNAVECEPQLEHNMLRIEESPELIYRGLKYAMEITNADTGIVAIKEKNKKAIESIKNILKDDKSVRIAELEDMYPMGEERAIIKHTLGVLLKTDQLPSAADAVVSNSETLMRITEAIEDRKPFIDKDLTVVGKLNKGLDPIILKDLPIGMQVEDILDRVGGIDGEYGEIVMGGPFTGKRTYMENPITKTTGGILVTIPFPQERRKMGLLVCACSADERRMRELAESMGAEVVAVTKCKQAVEAGAALKCEDPGDCPGQVDTVFGLKQAGAEVIMIGNCSDCSNTVMNIAPKLKIPVYHTTDLVMRTVNHRLVRRMK